MQVTIHPKEETLDSKRTTFPVVIYPMRKKSVMLNVLNNVYPVAQIGINEFINATMNTNESLCFNGPEFITLNDRQMEDGGCLYHGNIWGCYGIKIPKTMHSDQYHYATLFGYIVSTDVDSTYFTYTLRVIGSGCAWDLHTGKCTIVDVC